MNTTRNSAAGTSRRRALLGGAAAISVAVALMGCSAPASDSATGGSEDVELTFMNQSRGQEAALTQLAQQYTEETGITVTIDSPGPADYLPKLQSRAQSNSMPDIYSSFTATDMAPFYRAGWAMDLTEELKGGWDADFSPAVIEMSRFLEGNNLDVTPGIYSVHWETQTYGFLVNPALTGISDASDAATGEDLIAALSSADSDTGAFTVAASLSPFLLQGLASNWLSDEQIEATFNGELTWQSDAWRNALAYLLEMKDAGVIANDTLPGGQDDNPNVESSFFTQAVGAIFDASPGVSVGLRTNPEFQDYLSLPLPTLDGATEEVRSPGVPGKGAVVNPKGDHPEEALAFVKWLTEPEQQAVFAEVGRILPTNPELLASGDVPPQLAGFAAGVENVQLLSATFTSDVKSAITAEVQRLILGEATIDEVLANIQAAQDRSA